MLELLNKYSCCFSQAEFTIYLIKFVFLLV